MDRVLFVCVHNSARSQMAEAFLKKHGAGRFEVESAGLEPGKLNPVVVAAMQEVGIDISQNQTKSVFDFYQQGRLYSYVITVCDQGEDKCPIFPGISQRLHWSFPDPSGFQGTAEEKLAKTREVRELIENKVKAWVKTV
jgi:arsenate reductase